MDFRIYDERVQKTPMHDVAIHDAARPYVVMSMSWPATYWQIEGRYETLKAATERVRKLNKRS